MVEVLAVVGAIVLTGLVAFLCWIFWPRSTPLQDDPLDQWEDDLWNHK